MESYEHNSMATGFVIVQCDSNNSARYLMDITIDLLKEEKILKSDGTASILSPEIATHLNKINHDWFNLGLPRKISGQFSIHPDEFPKHPLFPWFDPSIISTGS